MLSMAALGPWAAPRGEAGKDGGIAAEFAQAWANVGLIRSLGDSFPRRSGTLDECPQSGLDQEFEFAAVEVSAPAIGTAIDTNNFFKNFLFESRAAFGTRHPVRLAFVFFFHFLLAGVCSVPHLRYQFLILLEEILVFLAVTELSHLISNIQLDRSLVVFKES